MENDSEHRKYKMNGIPIKDITLDIICGNEHTEPVSYWAPRREEIQRFVQIAKSVYTGQDKPTILDIGCGTGLLAYLLAQTGEVNVIGLDPDESLINQNLYTHPNLKLEIGDSKDALEKYANRDIDVVLNSWMPGGINLTPDIRKINAKSIIYIKEHGGSTGVPDYSYKDYVYDEGYDEWDDDAEEHEHPNPVSKEDYVSYEPGENYRRVFGWYGPACDEIRTLIRRSKGIDAFCLDTDFNSIEIQIRKDLPNPKISSVTIDDSQKYTWEKKLEELKGPLEEIEDYYW